MRLACILCSIVASSVANAAPPAFKETCGGGECPVEKELSDHASYLQINREAAVVAKTDSQVGANAYGPDFSESRRVVDYFRHWHEASAVAALAVSSDAPAEMKLIEGRKYALSCPGSAASGGTLDLLEEATGESVQHSLFRADSGRLQYMALKSRGEQPQIIHADPPVCAPSVLLEQASGLAGKDHPTGEQELLDPATDPMVKDCVALFERTVLQDCGKLMTFKVLTATNEVVDGMKVSLHGIAEGGPKPTHHNPRCFFETGKSKHSADDEPKSAQLPEERQGLRATLEMMSPLCEVGDHDGVSEEDKDTNMALEEHGLGNLALYKGYEHVNDDLPPIEFSEEEMAEASGVSSLDYVSKYRKCFPGSGGSSVIRNQGTCGSCWAFAGATSIMNALCINSVYKKRNTAAVLRGSKRYEVSVQQILSCGPGTNGCKGGFATQVDKKMKRNGITKESNAPYKCGSGNPLNHFQSGNNCKGYPWGGRCSSRKNTAWKYLGGYSLRGRGAEAKMKTALVSGYGTFVGFKTYQNFMRWGRSIYTRAGGRQVGGHAISLVGFGRSGRTNYWKLQNSWGSRWGDNGYVKMGRGYNLCDVEGGMYGLFTYKAGVGSSYNGPSPSPSGYPRRRSGYPRRRSPVPSTSCRDGNRYCADWARRGYCRSNAAYMAKTCKKSCNTCSGGCTDGNRYCADWARRGYCRSNAAYMKKTCKKSCRVCGARPATRRRRWR